MHTSAPDDMYEPFVLSTDIRQQHVQCSANAKVKNTFVRFVMRGRGGRRRVDFEFLDSTRVDWYWSAALTRAPSRTISYALPGQNFVTRFVLAAATVQHPLPLRLLRDRQQCSPSSVHHLSRGSASRRVAQTLCFVAF